MLGAMPQLPPDRYRRKLKAPLPPAVLSTRGLPVGSVPQLLIVGWQATLLMPGGVLKSLPAEAPGGHLQEVRVPRGAWLRLQGSPTAAAARFALPEVRSPKRQPKLQLLRQPLQALAPQSVGKVLISEQPAFPQSFGEVLISEQQAFPQSLGKVLISEQPAFPQSFGEVLISEQRAFPQSSWEVLTTERQTFPQSSQKALTDEHVLPSPWERNRTSAGVWPCSCFRLYASYLSFCSSQVADGNPVAHAQELLGVHDAASPAPVFAAARAVPRQAAARA